MSIDKLSKKELIKQIYWLEDFAYYVEESNPKLSDEARAFSDGIEASNNKSTFHECI